MKKRQLKTGFLSLTGAVLMGLLLSACNDSNQTSTAGKDETAKDTTTATTAVKAKKKGKASIGAASPNTSAKTEKDKDGVYTRAEVMPEYPGKDAALADYINSNLVYPEQAIDNNAEGTINVSFVVDDKGNVSDVKTIGNKLGYGLDEEAVNVVSKLSKWTPGKVKGKTVKTRLTIPITYKLEG